VRHQRIFYLDDANDIVSVDAKVGIDIQEVTFANVESITDFRTREHVATFRRYLEEGQYGIYAWLDSKVVGHAWATVCKSSHCRVNGYMDIYQGEAFIHYCSVSKNQRGQGIYPSMLVALCQRLFSQAKVKRVLIDAEIDNIASLHGIAKVGFKPLGTGTYVQFREYLLFKHFVNLPSEFPVKARRDFFRKGEDNL